MELSVRVCSADSPSQAPLEVVERKGIGHPDTVCDALVENLSAGLCRTYYERFGVVLHHNVDKALLVGGAARPALGGGEVVEPIEIILGGRAARGYRGAAVPVDELAVECSRAWLQRHLRHLDVARHVRIVTRIRPASADLAALFARRAPAEAPLANDTSIGTGFAPLDALERAVLAAERALNDPAYLRANPADGEDVKVLGVRQRNRIALTIARAMVGRHVASLDAYRAMKARIGAAACAAAAAAGGLECSAEVNGGDGSDASSIYLTVTGLSAEAGDDGEVGRGNRINGLITPDRPMSLEAAAGKNPVTHVGKLYNIVANRAALALSGLDGVREAECLLVSRIGQPITQPQLAEVRLRLEDPRRLASLRPAVEATLCDQLAGLPQLWRESLAGGWTLW